MKRIDIKTAIAAVKALEQVFGKCESFLTNKYDHNVWFVWGPSSDHYSGADKVQFAMKVASIPQVRKAAEKLGIEEEL